MIARLLAVSLVFGIASGTVANAPSSGGITAVAPLYDRMPGPGFAQPGVQVIVTVHFRNPTDSPLPIRLERAYSSFDAAKQGVEIKDVSLTDRRVCANSDSCSQFTLAPGAETGDITVLGRGLIANGQSSRLFVTLVFMIGQERVELRGFGDITSAD